MPLTTTIAHLITLDSALATPFQEFQLTEIIPSSRSVYESLLSAIAHQMVHANAAHACLARLSTACGTPNEPLAPAAEVVGLGLDIIRSCGFSRAKSQAILELAQAEISRQLPTNAQLGTMSDQEIIQQLLPLRGVGKWTVEMYLIFTLGRPDVFPVDDFGVREGYRIWQQMDVQLKPKEFLTISQQWRPYRSTVARLMWAVADQRKKIKNS